MKVVITKKYGGHPKPLGPKKKKGKQFQEFNNQKLNKLLNDFEKLPRAKREAKKVFATKNVGAKRDA